MPLTMTMLKPLIATTCEAPTREKSSFQFGRDAVFVPEQNAGQQSPLAARESRKRCCARTSSPERSRSAADQRAAVTGIDDFQDRHFA